MEIQISVSESYNRNKYNKGNHIVGISRWHFQWCTKYRWKMFRKWKCKKLIKACIRRVASMHGIKWRELEVQPEHVHGTAAIPMGMNASKALQLLKGISARLYFEHQVKARLRCPKGHLWSKGKFAASLGFISVETANKYIKNQDEHHETFWRTD